jgi:hypothetical protein
MKVWTGSPTTSLARHDEGEIALHRDDSVCCVGISLCLDAREIINII